MGSVYLIILILLLILNFSVIYTLNSLKPELSKKDKIFKITFVFLVPFIGAIVELIKISKNLSTSNNNVKWYAFWENDFSLFHGDGTSSGD